MGPFFPHLQIVWVWFIILVSSGNCAKLIFLHAQQGLRFAASDPSVFSMVLDTLTIVTCFSVSTLAKYDIT